MIGSALPALRWRRVPLPFRQVASETVIVDPRTREVHVLNRTGSRIWELLAEAQSLAGLVAALEAGFAGERDRLFGDVQQFLADLSVKQLVNVDGEPPIRDVPP